MKNLSIINTKGEKVSDIKLNEEIWGIEPNDAVIYDALRLARNNFRQGTADTKTRSEVSGGGRKPWRQKGTGRARQGSTRAPHWIKGGIVFGPHPRSYAIKMNRKERRLALKSALAYKAIESKLIVIDKLEVSNKTKDFKAILNNLKIDKKVLFVVDELNDDVILSSRNLNNVLLLTVDELNVYDIVCADTLVITESAVKQLEEVLV